MLSKSETSLPILLARRLTVFLDPSLSEPVRPPAPHSSTESASFHFRVIYSSFVPKVHAETINPNMFESRLVEQKVGL